MKKNKSINIMLYVSILVLVLPIAYSILYSWPIADDFSMAIGVNKSTVLLDAMKRANDSYLNHGGGWFFNFLQVLLNPLVYVSTASKWIGVELIIFFVTFLFTLWKLIKTFFEVIIKCNNKTIILTEFFLLLLCLFNTDIYYEIFYWFIGSVYLWAVILIAWTLIFEMHYFSNPCRKNAVILSILGFVACSFWMMAPYPCLLYLVYILIDWFLTKNRIKKTYIPFLFLLLGAISAMIAPGNFVRLENQSATGLQFVAAIRYALKPFVYSVIYLIKNPLFILFFLSAVVVGYCLLKEYKIRIWHLVGLTAATFTLLFVQLYVVALGYSSGDFPNRIYFVFNYYAILLFGICGVYFGGVLYQMVRMPFTAKDLLLITIMASILVYVTLIPNDGFSHLPYKRTIESIPLVKSCREEWLDVFAEIEESESEEVVIKRKRIPESMLKKPGISEEEDWWVNKEVAEFYGKKSIKIIWIN